LRLAAVAGARRAELVALQWSDVHDGMLTIDSSIEIVRRGDGRPELRDAATKTANRRTLADAITWAAGAGGPWIARIEPVLQFVLETRPGRAEPGSPTIR
jgi:integrase